MRSTQECQLQLNQLPAQARTGHISPGLARHSLISICHLFDAGCTAEFTANKVEVKKYGNILLSVWRAPPGLWHLPLTNKDNTDPQTPPEIHNAYNTTTKSEHMQYLHAAAFSLVPATWIKVIQKVFFMSWPGLTANAIGKYLPKSIATNKGHLDQTRNNVRSTQPKEPELTEPEGERLDHPTHQIFASIEPVGRVYTDQTGRFPVTSSSGHKYICILYAYDANAILADPIKSLTVTDILRAYTKMHKYITQREFKPRTHWLDNETAQSIKYFDTDNSVTYQLVLPGMHQQNAADKCIRNFKNHFVAGLSSTDDSFPLHLWYRLLPQATITFNMLRASRLNPKMSAYMTLKGAFDYNKTPFAPPGTKVVIHEKLDKRALWAAHSVNGWCLGPAVEHYRCYRVYVNNTRAERNADTIEFFPQHTKAHSIAAVRTCCRNFQS